MINEAVKLDTCIVCAEGFFHMWKGASLNICRAILMTLSQVSSCSTGGRSCDLALCW